MKFIRVLKASKDMKVVLMDYKDKEFQNSDGTHQAYLLLSIFSKSSSKRTVKGFKQ